MVNPGVSFRFLDRALALAALDPLDRLQVLLEAGCPPGEALEAVSRDLPKRPRRSQIAWVNTLDVGEGEDPWALLQFLIGCLRKPLIALPLAVDLLLGRRIHPWSLLWGPSRITGEEVRAWGAGLQVPEPILAWIRAGMGRSPVPGPDLEELPGDLKVEQLSLGHCPRLVSIGSGLEVDRDLMIQGCGLLASLPEGLRVLGSVWVGGCSSFARLPAQFTCGGLRLEDLPLLERLELPPRFTGDLLVQNCPALGGLKVWSQQLNQLRLFHCPVPGLPQGLRVDQRLGLRGLPITALPSGLQVGGSCRLEELPACTALGEGIRIAGDLVLDRLPMLRTVPGDLSVGGRVRLAPDLSPALLPRTLRDRVAPLEG